MLEERRLSAPFDKAQGDRQKHMRLFSSLLHRPQRLNDVQARSSDRRQKTTDKSHEQGKAKGRCDDGRGKSEGKSQLGERAEIQC